MSLLEIENTETELTDKEKAYQLIVAQMLGYKILAQLCERFGREKIKLVAVQIEGNIIEISLQGKALCLINQTELGVLLELNMVENWRF